MGERLFVYGTLMRDAGHALFATLSQNARYLGEATIRARMYLVDSYPGAVATENESSLVHGELYEIANARQVFEALDDYEGCSSACPAPTEYVRRKMPAALRDGGTHDAWVYIYNRPTAGLREIASGRFLDRP
jgi:gamma-glutamylcyclotransferase (GGCT)/AIG2-like uncharacterized protein YtfP